LFSDKEFLEPFVAWLMFASVLIYFVLGGRDFGSGIWHGLLRKRPECQKLIESSIAPIWEANHVWLILALVLLFTGFPTAFGEVVVNLRFPLFCFLLATVLRGSTFVFKLYDPATAAWSGFWGSLFAVNSFFSAYFFGVIVAAFIQGDAASSINVFTLFSGFLGVSITGFLSSVLHALEAKDVETKRLFSRAAVAAAAVVVFSALLAGVAANYRVSWFFNNLLFENVISFFANSALLFLSIFFLRKKKYKAALLFAICFTTGFALLVAIAQSPYLVYPGITFSTGAAGPVTLNVLATALTLASPFVIFSFYLLYKLFKGHLFRL